MTSLTVKWCCKMTSLLAPALRREVALHTTTGASRIEKRPLCKWVWMTAMNSCRVQLAVVKRQWWHPPSSPYTPRHPGQEPVPYSDLGR